MEQLKDLSLEKTDVAGWRESTPAGIGHGEEFNPPVTEEADWTAEKPSDPNETRSETDIPLYPNKARFEALAKLMRLRHGGKAEEAASFDVPPDDDDISGDEDNSTAATIHGDSNDNNLRRAFLDRLAELVANVKGGPHVSATLMIERPDRVDVLVAKNQGFKQNDPTREMLVLLQSKLRKIPEIRDWEIDAVKEEIWEAVVHIYSSRIREYVRDLRIILRAIRWRPAFWAKTLVADGSSTAPVTRDLKVLYDLIKDSRRLDTTPELKEVVEYAYRLWKRYDKDVVQEIIGSDSKTQDSKDRESRRLHSALGFLGKLAKTVNTVVRAAKKLQGFSNVSLIQCQNKTAGPPRTADIQQKDQWSLNAIFAWLQLPLDDESVTKVMGKRWCVKDLRTKFSSEKSPRGEVHGEVQIVLEAAAHDAAGARVFPYIGCSKRSCFLCAKFLEGYQGFHTRGSHGTFYNLWTIPQSCYWDNDMAMRIRNAIESTEKAMRDILLHGISTSRSKARESTIGGSSVAMATRNFEGEPLTLEWIEVHRQADRIAALIAKPEETMTTNRSGDFLRPKWNEKQLDRLSSQPAAPDIEEGAIAKCQICEKATHRRCSSCNRDYFCSERCEDNMELEHLIACSKRRITTADCMADFATRRVMPDDDFTQDDFGFSRCRTLVERRNLLGLYVNLGTIPKQTRASVRDLPSKYDFINMLRLSQEQGCLAEIIIEAFTMAERLGRDPCPEFHWFLENRHVLDFSQPIIDSSQLLKDECKDIIKLALDHLPASDEPPGGSSLATMPWGKQQCFYFLTCVLSYVHPSPESPFDSFYSFGFAACRTASEVQALWAFYGVLLGGNAWIRKRHSLLGLGAPATNERPGCPLDEFWRSWENGQLLTLFDIYLPDMELDTLSDSVSSFLHMPPDRTYFSNSKLQLESHHIGQRRRNPSVWRLKHFLAFERTKIRQIVLGENPSLTSALREAAEEYGFTADMESRTMLELFELYRKLLEVQDAMPVHEARQSGRLHEFIESTSGDLLRNVDDGVQRVLKSLT